jgi:hypothetical protein
MIWPALYSIRDDAGLESTGLRAVFDGMEDLGAYITVPVALTDALGVIFTDADGNVLTYGTQRVRPIEESE